MDSEKNKVTQWLNTEIEKAFTEKVALQERQSLEISWKEAVFSFPTLSALLLQQYRVGHENLPSYQHCYERYGQLCLELPQILADPAMPLSNEQLIVLAYALHLSAFEAFPSKIKKRLRDEPNFDKNRVAKTYSSFFVLKMIRRWEADKESPLLAFEKNALAHFFKRQVFFNEQGPIAEQELLHQVACFIHDRSRHISQREQVTMAFIQTNNQQEFIARCRYLNQQSDDLNSSITLLKLIAQDRLGGSLSDIVGKRCSTLIETLPFFEEAYLSQLFFIEQKKEIIYQKLLVLLAKSRGQWERDPILVGQPQGSTRYQAEADLTLVALPTISVAMARPLVYLFSDPTTRPVRRNIRRDLTYIMIEFLAIGVGVLWASELQRHRLTHGYLMLSGIDPYTCVEAELRLGLRAFIDGLSRNSTLDLALKELESLLSNAGSAFKYDFFGVICDGAPLLSVADFDRSQPASEQICNDISELLGAMKNISQSESSTPAVPLLLSPEKKATTSVSSTPKV